MTRRTGTATPLRNRAGIHSRTVIVVVVVLVLLLAVVEILLVIVVILLVLAVVVVAAQASSRAVVGPLSQTISKPLVQTMTDRPQIQSRKLQGFSGGLKKESAEKKTA